MSSFFNIFKTPKRSKLPTNLPSSNSIIGPQLIKQAVNPIGMSYWRNINYHTGRDTFYLLLSINDELIIFVVGKQTLQVLDSFPINIHHTGEGCYFSSHDPNLLYVPIDDCLWRVEINTGRRDAAWILHDGNNLWQCNSSWDENVHSATIKDASYNIIKWGVLDHNTPKYYDIKGEPDECQIDKSGQFLVIKEDNYNRIITLVTGEERIISNIHGALGHSDNGFNCIIGENDYSPNPGACDYIDLFTLERKLLYSTGIWNMGYVCTVGDKVLITTPTELILVNTDGSNAHKVCDNLTQDQDYENRPKANMCPLAEFAAFTSFVDGSLNAYVVRL